MNNNTKSCSKCKSIKPLENFVKDNRRNDGCGSSCKECFNKTNSKYREANKPKITEYNRNWKLSNKELVSAQNKRNYLLNQRDRLERASKYRLDNPTYGKEWDLLHPESVINKRHNYRARKYGQGKYLIRKSFLSKLYKSACLSCETLDKIEADHIIPVSRGGRHNEGNLIPLCRSCNAKKSNKTWMEYRIYKLKIC